MNSLHLLLTPTKDDALGGCKAAAWLDGSKTAYFEPDKEKIKWDFNFVFYLEFS